MESISSYETPSLHARAQKFFKQGYNTCMESCISRERELLDHLAPLTKQKQDLLLTTLGKEHTKVVSIYFNPKENYLLALAAYPHFLDLMDKIKILSSENKLALVDQLSQAYPIGSTSEEFPWMDYMSKQITLITTTNTLQKHTSKSSEELINDLGEKHPGV